LIETKIAAPPTIRQGTIIGLSFS